jgi:phosphoglycolate phosphatase
MSFVVGFDLDMTLLDTAAGIAATYRALTAATGVRVDADLAVSRLGPSLATEIAQWFPTDDVPAAVATYRALYPGCAIERAAPLAGAAGALNAVRDAGGQVVVITAKFERFARMHLDHVGFAVDEVVGDVFASGKTEALRALGVSVFVGDHVADVRSARAAGPDVTAVGVATGPCAAEELTTAGAHVVLTDLTGFPRWLAAYHDRGLARDSSDTADKQLPNSMSQ